VFFFFTAIDLFPPLPPVIVSTNLLWRGSARPETNPLFFPTPPPHMTITFLGDEQWFHSYRSSSKFISSHFHHAPCDLFLSPIFSSIARSYPSSPFLDPFAICLRRNTSPHAGPFFHDAPCFRPVSTHPLPWFVIFSCRSAGLIAMDILSTVRAQKLS